MLSWENLVIRLRSGEEQKPVDTLIVSLCRFCVGDKFFLKNNMILCQLDYEGGHLNGGSDRQLQ